MKKEIITHKEPKSPISEIFRTLRTNVQFANTKRGLHSLLITSTCPGEGKSWTAANLAVAFAQTGKRVILIDCDMRKGRQFSIFDVAPTPGLSNFLSGINSNGEDSDPNILTYLKETEVNNLYLITAGNIPPNPSELLVSEQMEQAIDELKAACDLVILDGTPCNLVTDSVIISRYVDTTLVVSAYKTTKIDDLQKVKRDIENVGGKIAGVVINKMPTSQKQYYSTYYYGNSSLGMKERRSSKEQKEQEELQIEMKRQELKEKSRNILSQNREFNNVRRQFLQIDDFDDLKRYEALDNKKDEATAQTENKTEVAATTIQPIEQNNEQPNMEIKDLLKQTKTYLHEENNPKFI